MVEDVDSTAPTKPIIHQVQPPDIDFGDDFDKGEPLKKISFGPEEKIKKVEKELNEILSPSFEEGSTNRTTSDKVREVITLAEYYHVPLGFSEYTDNDGRLFQIVVSGKQGVLTEETFITGNETAGSRHSEGGWGGITGDNVSNIARQHETESGKHPDDFEKKARADAINEFRRKYVFSNFGDPTEINDWREGSPLIMGGQNIDLNNQSEGGIVDPTIVWEASLKGILTSSNIDIDMKRQSIQRLAEAGTFYIGSKEMASVLVRNNITVTGKSK